MSRYIDADKFIEDNAEIIDCEIDHREYQDTIRELIEEAPLAEVKPIVRGKWICANESCAICSKCNRLNEMYGDFCKYCGADMRKESEEEE